jgi:hypothetical protein
VIYIFQLTISRRYSILRSYGLNLSRFTPVYMEKNRRISIEVFRPGTQDLLGFVRFEYNKDGLFVGGLKMANLKASLEFHTLSTGAKV